MQRRYPRTAEDREAIAAARRRHYAMQAANAEVLSEETEPTEPTEPPNPVKPIKPGQTPPPLEDDEPNDDETEGPTDNSGENGDTATTSSQQAEAGTATKPSVVKIPADFEKLPWKDMRALAKNFTTQQIVDKTAALKAINDELARRAAAPKA